MWKKEVLFLVCVQLCYTLLMKETNRQKLMEMFPGFCNFFLDFLKQVVKTKKESEL